MEIKEFKDRIFSKFIILSLQFAPLPNFLSEWCGSGESQKRPPKDSTKTYSLGRFTFSDAPLSQEINFASERVRLGLSQKKIPSG